MLLRNLFNKHKPEPVSFRTKTIDWDKVKTLEEVIMILKNMERFSNIEVDEDFWNDSKIKGLLGSVITETTYRGFEKTIKVYEE